MRTALSALEGPMLEPSRLDLDELVVALQDQESYDHRWFIDPDTGEVVFWTPEGGVDGETPTDPDEMDLVPIDPLPSHVWYRDMADFADGITDERAGRRLERAIQGRGAFRRFRDELHEEYPHLLPAWYAFGDARARRRALEWLADSSLVDRQAANRLLVDSPDPDLP